MTNESISLDQLAVELKKAADKALEGLIDIKK